MIRKKLIAEINWARGFHQGYFLGGLCCILLNSDLRGERHYPVESWSRISFKGARDPNEMTLFAVIFYVRYSVSYQNLEEIIAERSVSVDQTTPNLSLTKKPDRPFLDGNDEPK
ncbi:hypothetical protein [Ruegeria sp. AU67]|uniref:hypothetical protein n=1 Tax=Ruegeria sp. AU67 TaxID=2108530 RepID=UPI0013584F0B